MPGAVGITFTGLPVTEPLMPLVAAFDEVQVHVYVYVFVVPVCTALSAMAVFGQVAAGVVEPLAFAVIASGVFTNTAICVRGPSQVPLFTDTHTVFVPAL